ncbi:MAG: hypothetical protein GX757_02995 [Clostridiales bacterium]|nr:hypothetical protein [Clostridiales bacterium]
MQDIIIEEINYKAIIRSFINMTIFVTAIALVIYGFEHAIAAYWLPGLIMAVIISFFLIDSLLEAVKEKRLLTITREGIIDNSKESGLGFISFDDIKEFKIVTIYNKKAIAIIPRNMASFSAKYKPAKQRTSRRNAGRESYPVAIFVNRAKDMAAEDILSLLQKRHTDIVSLGG